MALTLFPLFALTTPPPTVALSDGPEFATMALLAVLFSAASIALRRMPRSDAATLGAGHARVESATTRARS
jgi:hypothetical protein